MNHKHPDTFRISVKLEKIILIQSVDFYKKLNLLMQKKEHLTFREIFPRSSKIKEQKIQTHKKHVLLFLLKVKKFPERQNCSFLR